MLHKLLFAAFLAIAAAIPKLDSKLELYQVTPNRLKDAVNGTKTIFTAFVNPNLPHSAHFHRILHEVKDYYANRNDVVVSFADISTHRSFLKQFGIKEVPAVRVFARLLPAKLPVPLEYAANKTSDDFIREVNQILHTVDGFSKDALYLSPRLESFMKAVNNWEMSMAKSHSLKKKKEIEAKNATAQIAANGEATHTETLATLDANIEKTETVYRDAKSNATTLLKDLQSELLKQAEHYEELARISRRRLEYLNRTLALAAGYLQPHEVVSKETIASTKPGEGDKTQITQAFAHPGFSKQKKAKNAEGEEEEDDEEDDGPVAPGGSGALARELNQRMRVFAVGNEFLNKVLKEEALLAIGVLQHLLEPLLQK